MGFIIETPLSPHMAGRLLGLIARDSLLPYMASGASRCKVRLQSPSLVPWNRHGHLEQVRTDSCPACSVKVSVRFVVVLFPRAKVPPRNRTGHLEEARIDLCPAGSIKVGHFEQTRTDLCPARSIKVDHLEQAPSDLCPACPVKVSHLEQVQSV